MIEFYFDLIGYKEHKVIEKVKRIKVINNTKLQSGIDDFNRQLNWDNMWTVTDAKERLEKNWWFYVIEEDNKYIGWAWFDEPNKQFCNLYVHKDYRDKGYGKELTYKRLNECKRMDIQNVWMKVDEWNKPEQKITQELGWSPKIEYTF